MRFTCLVVFCTSAFVGCNGSTPTAPTPPAPPVVMDPLPPASAVVGISLLGDQWIPTNTAAPIQMTAGLVTSDTAFEYTLTDGVTWSIEPGPSTNLPAFRTRSDGRGVLGRLAPRRQLSAIVPE